MGESIIRAEALTKVVRSGDDRGGDLDVAHVGRDDSRCARVEHPEGSAPERREEEQAGAGERFDLRRFHVGLPSNPHARYGCSSPCRMAKRTTPATLWIPSFSMMRLR